MFHQLSLSNSTNIHTTFSCYTIAFINLIIFSLLLSGKIIFVLDRWDENIIYLLHYFILGFIFPIILGSLSQLLPVLFGIEFKYNFIFVLLSFLTALTPIYFQNIFNINLSLIQIFIFALSLSLFFIAINLKTIIMKIKNVKTISLMLATAYFIVGIFISQMISFSYHQYFNIAFRPNLTNLHAKLMILGGLFHLIFAVSSNVIPMFFVTKNIKPKQMELFIFLYNLILILEIIFNNRLTHIFLFLAILAFCLTSITLLHMRKRKIASPAIHLWYLFLIGIIITMAQYSFEIKEEMIGPLIFLFVIPAAIFAMLIKIIPFLLWLNLNNRQLSKLKFDIQIPTVNDFYDPFLNWIILFLLLAIFICLFTSINIIPAIFTTISIIFILILFLSYTKFKHFKKLLT